MAARLHMLPTALEIGPNGYHHTEQDNRSRKIGRRTGEGPSAVIRRLAEREAGTNDNAKPVPAEVVKQRMRQLEESRLRHAHADDLVLSWTEIEEEMDSIVRADFEPQQPRR